MDRLTLAPDALPMGGNWYPEEPALERLVDLVETGKPERVVCCGGGLAAAVLARAQAQAGRPAVTVLEDDPAAIDLTHDMLTDAEANTAANVIHAELQDYDKGLWYDRGVFNLLPAEIDFLMIDGPGHFAGPMPRWPAGPELFGRLARDGVVVLDDANRVKQKKALKKWAEAYPWMRRDKKAERAGLAVLRSDHEGWS